MFYYKNHVCTCICDLGFTFENLDNAKNELFSTTTIKQQNSKIVKQ